MSAENVVEPEKWERAFKLFDNGQYSVISDGNGKLGTRWNASSDPFNIPKMTGYALALDDRTNRLAIWHIVPKFLEVPILHVLLDELAKNPGMATNPDEKILPEIRRRLRNPPPR